MDAKILVGALYGKIGDPSWMRTTYLDDASIQLLCIGEVRRETKGKDFCYTFFVTFPKRQAEIGRSSPNPDLVDTLLKHRMEQISRQAIESSNVGTIFRYDVQRPVVQYKNSASLT